MAKFIVPKNVGTCTIGIGGTGLWTVTNHKRGKDAVFIPCKTKTQAESLCNRLNSGDHNGVINIPKNAYHVR